MAHQLSSCDDVDVNLLGENVNTIKKSIDTLLDRGKELV
jgi:hypothetical protein